MLLMLLGLDQLELLVLFGKIGKLVLFTLAWELLLLLSQ
jgi:hypothetical protein